MSTCQAFALCTNEGSNLLTVWLPDPETGNASCYELPVCDRCKAKYETLAHAS